MNSKLFFKILLLLILPIFLYSENIEKEPVKLIKVETIEQTKDVQIEENTNTTEVKTQEEIAKSPIEKQIEEQNKLLEDVIKNINTEKYLTSSIDIKTYKKEMSLLTNKININRIEKNTLAVKRDEIKRAYLKQEYNYEQTLKSIVLAKQEYKDKKYFENLIKNNLKSLEKDQEIVDKNTKLYDEESKNKNTISNAFSENYIELHNQTHIQTFVLEYLLDNMSSFRKTNFFIDEFNLQYLVNKIDSIYGISFISGLTSYHLKFSIGQIVVVIFIMGILRLLNLKIISLIANLIARFFVRSKDADSESIRQYLRMSIDTPLKYSLYLLGIQISVFILVDDPILIETIMPWINTTYMALLTWGLYAILNNSINIYAHTLLEKYPNVRKEMIVFILRIIKIILILLVILFLFTQLGIDIKAIAASLGVGGIAIALASKDTLANFFSSLNIMTDNSFSQGDWIKTSNVEGTVVDIRMRTTRIRTFDNAMITVPNTQLANTPIINWSKRKIGRRIKMTLGITYDSQMKDIVQLKKDIFEMLDNHPNIASNKNIQESHSRRFEAIKKEDLQGIKRTLLVYIDSYGASSIDILIYCFSRSPDWEEWLITKEDVLVKLEALVKKNNCDFAYPTQTIMLKKEEELIDPISEKLSSMS
ncbi:mechanosensitive ion channel family protein [Poseidonibacter ostreae]|jgi:MscS family membrane protein|uniref:Mechanosensitive ion channel n=1 Tax=Poseidonibacter ostreae TaxID=2654171 RepID=A0A6L4WNZ7_9BACT|nr:mechanosensitive ion channel family protein [Poseidonibacter ostreae]KAB7883148.1 mechanosensitive ion channel [Poseidonibacter ostreae]KAB7885153.1 mechanosensitive ion channel [Poseidonibacter ostreae]KAB7887629.1 mechanosensitive ion channel [Poseidonibacter ostreae]